MIEITGVQIKTTRKGDPYKALSLSNGKTVSMWCDDPDYDMAQQGVVLEREIEQSGQYWNLLPQGSETVQKPDPAILEGNQLNSIWWLLTKIADKLEIEYEEKNEVKQIQEKYDTIIYPENIPF